MIKDIMKDKKENFSFGRVLVLTILLGIFVDFSFVQEANIIVFISIMIGFQITSVSILFNSKILYFLYQKTDPHYSNELLRLTSYYKTSILFGVMTIMIIIFFDPSWLKIEFKFLTIEKSSFMPALFSSSVFWFYKSTSIFFTIFIFPRNEE